VLALLLLLGEDKGPIFTSSRNAMKIHGNQG